MLVDYIYSMSNIELNNLAKNRFIGKDLQMAIAQSGNYRARLYLAENPNIERETVDILWSGKSFKVKLNLVAANHLRYNLDAVEKLYFDNLDHRCISHSYQRCQTFITTWMTGTCEVSSTPRILNHIYDWLLQKCREKEPNLVQSAGAFPWAYKHYSLRMRHNSAFDITLAIKMSQSENDEIRKLGFEKIVELSS